MQQTLLDAALDLTASVPKEVRLSRLIAAVRRTVDCDAVAILRLRDDGVLVPIATEGLAPELLAARLRPEEHPRLAALLAAQGPVRFAADDPRPDPYDGFVEESASARLRVHSCMGSALRVDGEVFGVLTLDALEPGRFDHLDPLTFSALAAITAATLRTAALVEALSKAVAEKEEVTQQLVRESLTRGGGDLLGSSPAIERLRAEVALVAEADMPVLVTGETGVGKELVARTLHARSVRSKQTLVYVNCAALPETIAESELFGHKRGAFTGAIAERKGKFELAHKGTLFLDEIGELPLSVQPLLLRALQFGEIQRVGDDAERRVDVRIIAATNRDLHAEVAAGRFRADLFHRLSVFPIHAPPLRERDRDVELLAGYFLDRARSRLGIGPRRLSAEAKAALHSYGWPGNVRELEHVILRAALRSAKDKPREGAVVEICGEHLGLDVSTPLCDEAPAEGQEGEPGFPALADATHDYQRALLRRAYRAAGDSWSGAARLLHTDRSNLHRLGRRLGLHESAS